MNAPSLLLAAALLTGASARPEGGAGPAPNVLAGPARCVLRYLEAIRQAAPHEARATRGKRPASDERWWAAARRLTAPRTLEEIDRRAARGESHPLAALLGPDGGPVLHSFQLLAARRAPLGAAIVTVTERFSRLGASEPLEDATSEYLVVRVGGEWRLADRRPGRAFDPVALADALAELAEDPSPDP